MEVSQGIYDFRLENDSTMIVTGPSKSGKSTLVTNMIKQKDSLFKHPIRKIWWFYGIESPFHDTLKSLGIILKQGLPSHEDLDVIQQYDMVILDDLQQESKGNDEITSLFLKASHHKGFFAIQITQYAFGDKDQRMRNANVHYYVAFNNPRNQQSTALFLSKMLPKGNINLIYRIFGAVMKEDTKYGYIFVDFTPKCKPELRFRTRLFQKPMIVFKLNIQQKHYEKMDFSEMVVIPKSEYESIQQTGGKLDPMEEAKRIDSLMQPKENYIRSLAQRIVRERPTPETVDKYTMKLATFDDIRRNYFNIPWRKDVAPLDMVPRSHGIARKLVKDTLPTPVKRVQYAKSSPMKLRQKIKAKVAFTPQDTGKGRYASPRRLTKIRRDLFSNYD